MCSMMHCEQPRMKPTIREVRMPLLGNIVVHESVTEKHGYQYQFTPKHHGAVAKAAQWLPSLSLDDEFAVFNLADEHELSAGNGWLYGVRSDGNDRLEDLGTWEQQIAEFPQPDSEVPWHGYPVWAVN